LELTRKDKITENVRTLQEKFGRAEFDILPETYVLPNDFKHLKEQYEHMKSEQ
jgi:hypothetical protein